MTTSIQFPNEAQSNAARQIVADREALALRTFTPTQAVLAKSAGVFHWTPENRRLYDYSSGVLVANLGHNPKRWLGRLAGYMGWSAEMLKPSNGFDDYYAAVPLTAYNAVTEIETRAAGPHFPVPERCLPLASPRRHERWSQSNFDVSLPNHG